MRGEGVLRSFFDGGNHADSRVHEVVVLAAISGTRVQWQSLKHEWISLMKRGGADRCFHTTNLVALSGPFSRDNGWNEDRRDQLLGRCVSLLEGHIAHKITAGYPGRLGLYPFTVTVNLSHHKRARADNPDVPNNANTICAVQAFGSCLAWGLENMKVDSYKMVFDRGEPFKGHAEDRVANKNFREQFPYLAKVSITEADAAGIPELQIADLYAWCVGQQHKRDFKWQKRLLGLDRHDEWLEYENLVNPEELTVRLAREWKLPLRRTNP